MKNIITLLATIIIYSAVNAQPKNVEKDITEIRKTYNAINSSYLLSNSYKYSNRCGVINATITIYYLNGEIVKITDNGIGDDDKLPAKWSIEYYYKNGELIFSYVWMKYYDVELEKDLIYEIREYFKSNNLIKIIENQKTTYPTNKKINYSDHRYRIKKIKSTKDVHKIFECLY